MTAVSTLAPRARRKMVPPAPPHAVTQYALDVIAGRIVAGNLVRKAAERHIRDLADGPARGVTFNPGAADRAIAFFGLLRHYEGRTDQIVLEAWQKFLVGSAFGWRRGDGSRRFRRVYVEVAKKNGKTTMAAGMGLLLAFFDGEPGAQVYSVATKRDQAKLCWNGALQMVKRNPDLAKRLETLALTITDLKSGSFFRPLGRDADSDQGINVHGAIIDELHVIENRDTVDNIETATSSRRQPMVVKITTAGVTRESVWAEERADAVAVVEGRATDDSMLAMIYTLDEGDDPFDEKVWPKGNPNLGVSLPIDSLREYAEVAKRSPGKLAAFLRYRMNIPTAISTRAIDIDLWDRWIDPDGDEHRQDEYEPEPAVGDICYAGLDLASTGDLTALVMLFRAPDGLYDTLCRFWCPEDGVVTRSRRDGVPYADWIRDGYLIATSGNLTDYSFVKAEILSFASNYTIAEIGFDRWNALQLATDLRNEGAQMIEVSQNHTGLAPAWREIERLILEGRLRHGGHPILRWMAGNVEVETDAAGNQKPSKAHSREKIDGIVALDMALGRWMAHGAVGVWTAA